MTKNKLKEETRDKIKEEIMCVFEEHFNCAFKSSIGRGSDCLTNMCIKILDEILPRNLKLEENQICDHDFLCKLSDKLTYDGEEVECGVIVERKKDSQKYVIFCQKCGLISERGDF